jgi:hypothetical protein
LLDEGGLGIPQRILVHEQRRLDKREDFSDAKVVGGMRLAHGGL